MQQATLVIPKGPRDLVWDHLLGNAEGEEEAAFVFAKATVRDGWLGFEYVHHRLVAPEGFAVRSAYYIELSDVERGAVIKQAHDLGASLVEFHSHPYQATARLSPSDMDGLREFVPHVQWRLKGRPYAALVVGRTSFDGLAWDADVSAPAPVSCFVGGAEHRPTEESLREWRRGGWR